jgi:tetratricopeptide (TPR) repeat protein
MSLAMLWSEQRKYSESESEYRAVLEMLERVLNPTHPVTLTLLYNLAICLYTQGKQEEARPFAQRAAEGAREILGADHPYTKDFEQLYQRLASTAESASGLYARSYAAHARKEYEQAERLALASADQAIKEQPLDKCSVYQAFQMAGVCALELSNAVIAIAHFTNAATFTDKLTAPLEWARNQYYLARALEEDFRYPQAERLFREAVAIYTTERGPEHSETLIGRGRLAYNLTQQGNNAEAETEYRALIEIQQRVHGAEHRETLANRMRLASVLLHRGRYAQAEAENRQLLRTYERVRGSEDPETLKVLYNLSQCINRPNRAEEAKEYARRAAEGYRKVLGAEHPYTKHAETLYKQLSTPK